MTLSKAGTTDGEAVRSWPWMLWFLWKNRNTFIFEGKSFDAEEISRKVKKEADAWFLAQQVQNGMEEVEASVRVKGATKENHAVLGGWILCEFDMDWSKRHDTMGRLGL